MVAKGTRSRNQLIELGAEELDVEMVVSLISRVIADYLEPHAAAPGIVLQADKDIRASGLYDGGVAGTEAEAVRRLEIEEALESMDVTAYCALGLYLCGYSTEELVGLTGYEEGNLRTCLARAMDTLREHLG